MPTVTLNPVTRIEGHLAVHVETEPAGGEKAQHRVTKAWCKGEMFRGLETILQGRDPMDAQQITERVCGVCPVSHGMASIRAQEMAYGIKPTLNGRLLQNLTLAANYLQSHVLHFYHLAALDFVDVTAILKYSGTDPNLKQVKSWVETSLASKDPFAAAPFLPRFEVAYLKDADRNVRLLSHYLEALEVRRCCHEMAAVFGARLPHPTALVPGGCTQVPTMERVLTYRARLNRIETFIRNVYVPDMLEVAGEFPEYFDIGKSYGNFLAYGSFPMDDSGATWLPGGTVIAGKHERLDIQRISESVASSWFSSPGGLHPSVGETTPDSTKRDAYTWLKAPRYGDQPMEVGPLARVVVAYNASAEGWVRKEVDAFCAPLKLPIEKLNSVLGRHVARGLEATWLCRQIYAWLDQIDIDGPPAAKFEVPKTGSGYGLVEAPRGALGHWIEIAGGRIKRYQCVVPTTWNCSPRDDRGLPGPVEKALEGTLVQDPKQPMELGRIIRSFDPCIACAVH
jgi:Ni,Fe-hydrogenase I large subunit